jgi:hypothetical protein
LPAARGFFRGGSAKPVANKEDAMALSSFRRLAKAPRLSNVSSQARGCWRRVARLVVALAIIGPTTAPPEARPLRGSTKWAILLCTYMGAPPIPASRDVTYFRQMLLDSGTGGLADYWSAISENGLNLNGSVVKGWYTVPMTVAQAQAKSGGPNPRRGELVTDCISAARTSAVDAYSVPAGMNVAVIHFPDVDFYGGGGRAFVTINVDVGGLGHEMGHGLGYNHSFSDDPTYRNVDWAAIGEYDDPWDVMSYANVFAAPTARFGNRGPGVNAYHMDRMGWLPGDRIKTFGADDVRSQTLTLSALPNASAPGFRLIRVPIDPGDPFHYLTIEYRRKQGMDAGIPNDIVLFHEIKPIASGDYRSFLMRERTPARAPLQTVSLPGLTITVLPRPAGFSADQALVAITSDIADRCIVGFVWREAFPGDTVCVTPEVRTATRNDNAQAAARRQPGGGPFGPDTCRSGFVWREANASDHVCVPVSVRTRTASENASANARRNPARSVFGPNTCASGFVWREADTRDFVCVTPAIRTQTRTDNGLAVARRQPGGGAFGPNTCRAGFVWREAFPGDLVCVPPATRTQARNDNDAASGRLMRPGS